jgi:hypothetical protein
MMKTQRVRDGHQVEVLMLIAITRNLKFTLGACSLLLLAACGTNQSTSAAAPPVVAAPVASAPPEPIAPVAAPAAAVQAAPDPATREGRMAEALKGYEASKAAQQSADSAKKDAIKKPQPAKKSAKAASSAGV